MFNKHESIIDKSKIKTWFVTGASSGVGHEMCKQLLERGYNVIAVSRRIPDFSHQNALCLSCDVTQPETIKIALDKGIERFGKVDVLCNNAGISTSVVLEEETIDHMKRFFETNYFGTFNTMNVFLPYFRTNQNGTIINNSSQSGFSPRKGGAAYCSTKHAIEGLTSVCLLETEKFCRTIIFELGWFIGTQIGHGNMGSKKTTIPEYANTTYPSFKKINYSRFKNILDKAIAIIINEAEKEKPRRRIILGKDAQIRAKTECEWFKKDIDYSLHHFNDCIVQNNTNSLLINIILYYFYKILKHFVPGKTRDKFKQKQIALRDIIRKI